MATQEQKTTQYNYTEMGNEPRTTPPPSNLNVAFKGHGSAMPYNEEVEQVVLGALILERDAFAVVSEILDPECFYQTKNRKTFEAIRTLEFEQQPIDIQTVVQKLDETGVFNKIEGLKFVSNLVALVNSTAHLEYHARMLYDKKLQRALISFGNNVVANAYNEQIAINDTMQDAESELFKITQGANNDDVQPVSELIKDALAGIDQA